MIEGMIERLIKAKKDLGEPIGEVRQKKLLSNARTLERLAHGDLLAALKDEKKTTQLALRIESGKGRQGRQYTAWTRSDYRTLLKALWKLENGYDLKDSPKEMRWLKTALGKKEKHSPKNLITEDEILKMFKVAKPKEAAIISILYEVGLRNGEIVSLKKNDVEFIKEGVRICANGKTGERHILAVDCAPHIAKWLSVHPIRADDAALFPSEVHAHTYGTFTPEGLNKLVKTVAVRAGIKRRIHPHLFRHTAATRLAKHLTEQALKTYFGWEQDSNMAAVYVHLSGRDVDGQILAAHGKAAPKEMEENKLAPLNCERCGRTLAHDAKLCDKCGWPTDSNKAKQADVEMQAKLKRFGELEARLEKLEGLRAKRTVRKKD